MSQFKNKNLIVKCPHCHETINKLTTISVKIKCRGGKIVTKARYKNHKKSKYHEKIILKMDEQFQNTSNCLPYEIKLEIFSQMINLKKRNRKWPYHGWFDEIHEDYEEIFDPEVFWYCVCNNILGSIPKRKLFCYRLINKDCYNIIENKFKISEQFDKIRHKNCSNSYLAYEKYLFGS